MKPDKQSMGHVQNVNYENEKFKNEKFRNEKFKNEKFDLKNRSHMIGR